MKTKRIFGKVLKRQNHETKNERKEETAANILPVSSMLDHRVIDGSLAGKIINYFFHIAN
jgi:pyruvate/2-oxoglutarate dehydrogenase complex dihydrolipoamide acyltransferase (E2) component